MLDKEVFFKKYNTTYSQCNEEDILKTLSDECRELYSDVEILTGRNLNNDFNKFNNFGKANRGKTQDTVRNRYNKLLKKAADSLTDEEIMDIFKDMIKKGKRGSFKYLQHYLDRVMGKEVENVNLNVEGEMTFELMPDKNALDRQKKNKEKEEKSD